MKKNYIGEITAEKGEKFHIKGKVRPVCCEKHIAFKIRDANWDLQDENGSVKESGECTVRNHVMDALVEFNESGTFDFRYIYDIADETFIDYVKVKVGD